MHPELPFLAAGGVAIIGGAIREKKWPQHSTTAVVGTVTLVLVASATANTRIAPLVHAMGLLFLLASVMATVRSVQKKGK